MPVEVDTANSSIVISRLSRILEGMRNPPLSIFYLPDRGIEAGAGPDY